MADAKISTLNSLTKSTVATTDVLPIVDTSATETKKITYQELLQPLDSQFRIAGSSDTTKLVAFEVDGLTTATTRTLTVPDADLTLVGLTTTQTLTNKTLTSPQVNFGSDATGDIIYRTSGGVTARLAIGTSGQILQVSAAGIPEWTTNPAAADASTTVKGVVEKATSAEIIAGTSAGGTGALLFIGPDAVAESGANKILKLDSSGKLPALDGSQLTSIANPITYKCGQTTKNAADASTTQNIAHGLGKTPKIVRLTAFLKSGTASSSDQGFAFAHAVYNGTTQASASNYISGATPAYTTDNTFTLNTAAAASATQSGVVTFDSTNIIITWTKTGSPTGTYYLIWETEA